MPESHAMRKYQAGGYVAPDYAHQPAPAQPHIRIAPPEMSANAQKVIAQAMAMPSQNWGSALSKLANVWAANRAGERETEAKAQKASEQERRRGNWAQQLHSGRSLRDIASQDSSVLADTSFLDFAKTTTPEVAAEIELFENVDSPYGRGGVGQRSSTTGKISGYQSAPAQIKPPARATAKDRHGRLRYLDDSSVAFSDDVLGPDPTPPPSQGPSQKRPARDDATVK